jgi:hypothetical protein
MAEVSENMKDEIFKSLRELRDRIMDILDDESVSLIDAINLQYSADYIVNELITETILYEKYDSVNDLPEEVLLELDGALEDFGALNPEDISTIDTTFTQNIDLDNYRLELEEDKSIKVFKFEERI